MATRKNLKLGYKIDWANSRIIVNHKFAYNASIIGSEEYDTILKIQEDNPNIKVCVESGRKYTANSKAKGLTYDYMRHVLSMLPEGKELLEEFNNKVLVVPDGRHRYQFAKDWFVKQVPDYRYPVETLERIRLADESNKPMTFTVSKAPAKKAIKLS